MEIHGYVVKLSVDKWYFMYLSISKGTSGYGDPSFKPLCVRIGSAVSAVACLMEFLKMATIFVTGRI